MKPSLRRLAVPVAVVLTLGFTVPSIGFAAPGEGGFRWSDWLGFLSNFWASEGCSLEPVGRCFEGKADAPVPRDQGCSVEPVGRCTEASAPILRDQGCSLEPVGRCSN